MPEKFQNRYRIPSARLQNWDYGRNAAYFITICTQHRECWFGHIHHGIMVLSEIGEIVETEWLKTFEIRRDMNLIMGEYVVMPNHFHAIIIIGENEYNMQRGTECGTEQRTECGTERRDAMHCVSTPANVGTPANVTIPTIPNKFGPQSKNLASIVRGFKSGVTINARKINTGFEWQSRFYDHIIRNNDSFQRIANYIVNNPAKWNDDKFFDDNT
jgi:REP element-mobilizing transposase RayT